jgi:hypothetical protein
MKLLAALSVLIPASQTVLPGCPLQCGDWDGGGDSMYRSDQGDAVMLCSNGGYALIQGSGVTEGVFEYSDAIRGSNPETGARTFAFVTSPDGTATSEELPGTWALETLVMV